MHDDPEVTRILDAIVSQHRREWEAFEAAMRPCWEEQARLISQVLAQQDDTARKIEEWLSRWP